MNTKDMTLFYQIGKRDAVAEILMMVRNNKGDCKKVIQKLAGQMLTIDKGNPHAQWCKDNLSASTTPDKQ